MRKYLLILFFIPFIFGFTIPPEISVTLPTGTIKYVDADGTDCSNGDTDYEPTTASCGAGSATVYTTLENADGNVGSGNILKLREGTYNYSDYLDWDEDGASGSGNQILITVYTGETATFNFSGAAVFRLNADYIILDGGTWDGTNFGIILDGSGMTVTNDLLRVNGSNNIIRRIKVQKSKLNAGDGNGTNIGLRGNNDYAYNNLTFDAGDEGFYSNCGDNQRISGNIVYDNNGSGIQVNPHPCSSTNIHIDGNAIYSNGQREAGLGAGYRGGIALLSNDNTLYNVYVINNILWDNGKAGESTANIKTDSGASNMTLYLYNNTTYAGQDMGVYLKTNPTYDTRNNISCNNPTENWSGENDSNNITNVASGALSCADISWASTTVGDSDYLKLASDDTEAIDSGYNTYSIVSIDYFGNARPNSTDIDIGAHEYGASPPVAPTLIRRGIVSIGTVH